MNIKNRIVYALVPLLVITPSLVHAKPVPVSAPCKVIAFEATSPAFVDTKTSISANSAKIITGQTATISWKTQNCATTTINGSSVAAKGSMSSAVTTTKRFSLSAGGTMKAGLSDVGRSLTLIPVPVPAVTIVTPSDTYGYVDGGNVSVSWNSVGVTNTASSVTTGTSMSTAVNTLVQPNDYIGVELRFLGGTAVSSVPVITAAQKVTVQSGKATFALPKLNYLRSLQVTSPILPSLNTINFGQNFSVLVTVYDSATGMVKAQIPSKMFTVLADKSFVYINNPTVSYATKVTASGNDRITYTVPFAIMPRNASMYLDPSRVVEVGFENSAKPGVTIPLPAQDTVTIEPYPKTAPRAANNAFALKQNSQSTFILTATLTGSPSTIGNYRMVLKNITLFADDQLSMSNSYFIPLLPESKFQTPYRNLVKGDEVVQSQATTLVDTLSVGSEGEEVVTLQSALFDKGFLKGNRINVVDGGFGNKTKKAVQKYQKANKLPVTGTVDQALFDQVTK